MVANLTQLLALRNIAEHLRKVTTWTGDKMDQIQANGKEFSIRISPTVPVYIAYFTACVDSSGQINFRKELYGLDKKLAKEIFTKN